MSIMLNKKFGAKISAAFVISLLLLLILTPTATASNPGDINGDGRVDVQDGALVMKHVLGHDELTDTQKIAADINGDGTVNVLDVTLIIQEALAITGSDQAAGQLKVHFIDVGQGDSILIQTPSKNILIDGGERGPTALNYIKNRGVNSLDIIIGTHPHSDHIGGLIDVMEEIPVTEVIDPGIVHTSITFEDYLTIIDQKDITFTEGRPGIIRDLDNGIKLEIIHPLKPSSSDLNNASVVARLIFDKISFLFTGDIEKEAESEILNRVLSLKSNILKVGHHGSNSSTSQAFLDAVKPEAAVIMCGIDNTYGHPHDETLAKLTAAGADIYRTDLQGTIVFTTDGQTYQVSEIPTEGATPEPEPEPEQTDKVNINTASFEELQLIVHIGPDRAQEIINLRPFSSLDELSQVSGIGPSRLQDIKDEGIAYVD